MSPKRRTRGAIPPAKGISERLRAKAQSRRDTQRKIVEVERHAPVPRNDLVPELRFAYVPPERLTPAVRRVRRREKAQEARLDRSLARFGLAAPVLVDPEYRIIHGHGIWEAAKRAGCPTVPVICVSHLSQAECRLLGVALNRLGETGSWDEQALTLEFRELIEQGEDVVLTGFEHAEVDLLLLGEDGIEEVVEEDAEGVEPDGVGVSLLGDCWRLGRHLLIQGDARDPAIHRQLMADGELARIVLTDVPFNVPVVEHVTGDRRHREFAMASGEMTPQEFTAFIKDWIEACLPVLMDGGLLATFIDWRSVELVLACGRAADLELLNLVVWSKTNGGQGSLWRSQHELFPVFKKGTAPHVNNVLLGRWGRWRSNVWVYPGGSSLGSDSRDGLAVHPTVKPRQLLEDALLDISHRDEVVLDPFAGSGSTLLAAETTGRIGRAIEIDGSYCDVAIRRWQALTGEAAVLGATGQTFDEVVRERAGGAGDSSAEGLSDSSDEETR